MSELAELLATGNRRALAQAITLVESTSSKHRAEATDLLDEILPSTGGSIRLGISGTPGVGKSTFINAFGMLLIEQGHKVAVLAIDPTSVRTGGSILGDKTRMADLSQSSDAYIRPSPASGSLGGVALRTRDAVLVCEAAGYDIVIVETVGVGQNETAVADITDLFLLLIAPGGGDDLQGIKRGVMELADIIAVNKADGDLLSAANHTAADYRSALHLMRPKRPGQTVEVLLCSALRNTGLSELSTAVDELHAQFVADGSVSQRRRHQQLAAFNAEVSAALFESAFTKPGLRKVSAELERVVAEGTMSPRRAAQELIEYTNRAN